MCLINLKERCWLFCVAYHTMHFSNFLSLGYGKRKYCEMTPEIQNSGARAEPISKQRLGKHIPAATNTQATIEGLLGKDVFCWVRPETI
jgi:hypothetical protein